MKYKKFKNSEEFIQNLKIGSLLDFNIKNHKPITLTHYKKDKNNLYFLLPKKQKTNNYFKQIAIVNNQTLKWKNKIWKKITINIQELLAKTNIKNNRLNLSSRINLSIRQLKQRTVLQGVFAEPKELNKNPQDFWKHHKIYHFRKGVETHYQNSKNHANGLPKIYTWMIPNTIGQTRKKNALILINTIQTTNELEISNASNDQYIKTFTQQKLSHDQEVKLKKLLNNINLRKVYQNHTHQLPHTKQK